MQKKWSVFAWMFVGVWNVGHESVTAWKKLHAYDTVRKITEKVGVDGGQRVHLTGG